MSTRDTTYNVNLGSGALVLQGTSDGKFYVRTDVGSTIEIALYDANGSLDKTFGTQASGSKLVLAGINTGVISMAYIHTVQGR